MEEKIYTLEEIENVKEGKSFLKVRYSCCECGADIVKRYCAYKERLKENKLYCKDCGFKNHRNWKAEHEKAYATNMERYGTKHNFWAKASNTMMERYGVSNYTKTEEYREKAKKTSLEKYGVDHYTKTEEFKSRYKDTCIEKYGVPCTLLTPEVREKVSSKKFLESRYEAIKAAMIAKYGVENYFLTQEFKDRMIEYNLRVHGKKSWMTYGSEEFTNMMLTKYGVENCASLEEVKEKKKETCMKTYGVDSFSKTPEFAKMKKSNYEYEGLKFDSSWELYYFIFCKDNGIDIERNNEGIPYLANGSVHMYFPDFIINGNSLVEIKGDHFLENGSLVNPFDRSEETDMLYRAKYECAIEHNVIFITDIEEYKEFVDNKYGRDYIKNFRKKAE